MTTAMLTVPAAPAVPTTRRRAEPRLLLPPVAEPTGPRGRPTPSPLSPPPLRSVLSPVTETAWPLPVPQRPGSEPPLPDPTQLCGSLVLAAVEALAGIRPLGQLTRWVTPEVLEALTDRIRTTSRRVRTNERDAPGTTAAAARRPDSSDRPGRTPVARAPRATIRRTRLSRVSDRAVEAGVVLHDGSRVRAAALRLEVHRGHWRATVLQIG